MGDWASCVGDLQKPPAEHIYQLDHNSLPIDEEIDEASEFQCMFIVEWEMGWFGGGKYRKVNAKPFKKW